MKNIAISLLCLSLLLTACHKPNNIDMQKNDNLATKDGIQSNTENSIDGSINKKVDIFYLLNDDIVLQDNLFLEHRFPAILTVNKKCLSIETINEGKIYTLVIPNTNEVLFDENKNVIGLFNKSTKRKILISEKIGLSDSKAVTPTSSKKEVPKDCSETLLLTQEIV
ncbi:hypothetical protein LU290_08365 [Moraxella nasibovis]|uniref:hypothetical protein n=1 Tax=Moraxella nasibovis TaxID=2904120 RepID=UPI00240ED28E|nr:hypothetical protein [Moraxella nasibovis]WFF38263.1 hypothetical protein LU290_08365 [Moraxella nasibovis]